MLINRRCLNHTFARSITLLVGWLIVLRLRRRYRLVSVAVGRTLRLTHAPVEPVVVHRWTPQWRLLVYTQRRLPEVLVGAACVLRRWLVLRIVVAAETELITCHSQV